MAIHPIAEEVIRSGSVALRDGGTVRAHSYVSRGSCELLYELVQRSGATRGLEIGMAFAVSTICLADALRANAGDAHLVSFDPTQTRADSWNGAGLWQLERAGLAEVVELREETSQEGLPRLVEEGYRCGIAFIDGWHTFDHTLLDFFYADRMLDVGGHAVFDDVDYPAIEAVLRFVLANRNYELAGIVERPEVAVSPLLRAKRAVKGVLRHAARTDRDAASNDEELFRRIARAETVAVKKVGEDDRRFDHYRAF